MCSHLSGVDKRSSACGIEASLYRNGIYHFDFYPALAGTFNFIGSLSGGFCHNILLINISIHMCIFCFYAQCEKYIYICIFFGEE